MIPGLYENHAPDRERKQFAALPNMGIAQADSAQKGEKSAVTAPTDQTFIEELKFAEQIGSQYTLNNLAPRWQRSYHAYRSKHHSSSKYASEDYKFRSTVFKPKTRSAVRKNLAATAAALFATGDVVKLTASDESNPHQVASAALKTELINYRLSRTSGRNGIPWFSIAMGASQTAQITGICISEQFWKFEQRPDTEEFAETVDEETGNLTKSRVTKPGAIVIDRPEIDLHPNENVIIDPNAHWLDPAQSAGFIIFKIPMTPDNIMTMMESAADDPRYARVAWRDVSREQIISAGRPGTSVDKTETRSTRQAREGQGQDRLTDAMQKSRFTPVWVYKTYMKVDGESYVFWSVGPSLLISDPQPVIDVYPEQGGERPIVIGFGALEAFNPFPMSAVESWLPLQQEANDITNLRLDRMKDVVNPVKKVVRGKNVDLTTLNRVGANRTVMVQAETDVTWDTGPDVPASAFAESEYINNDFDDLAGTFNQASVAGNRKLNETVGGMKMLASSAGSVTQFDLRIWIETWVEPVLRQVLKLEEMWESDATILAVCGDRAELVERFGINEITDTLLMQDATVRVDAGVGMGSPDPMEKVQKMALAADTAIKMLAPFFENGSIKLIPKDNGREVINEVFGAAGYRDGGDRFFDFANGNDPNAGQPQPDPRVAAEAAKLQAEADERAEKVRALKAANQAKEQGNAIDLQMKDEVLAREKIETALKQEEAGARRQAMQLDRTGKAMEVAARSEDIAHQRDERQIKQIDTALSFNEKRQQAALTRETAQDARQGAAADREDMRADRQAEREEKTKDRELDRTIKTEQRADEKAGTEQKLAAGKQQMDQDGQRFEQEQKQGAESHRAEMSERGEKREADKADHEQSTRHREEDHAQSQKHGKEAHGLDMKGQKAKADDHDKKQDEELKALRKELAETKSKLAALSKTKGGSRK